MIRKTHIGRVHRLGYFALALLMAACAVHRPATRPETLPATKTNPATDVESALPGTEVNTTSLRDGVFSQAQVETGRTVFQNACIECHQPEAFVGPGFIDAWSGQTVDVLFQEIRETMPEDAPGRLSRREYAAVLAYIFHLNGLPTGENDMPNRPQQLREIRIESVIDQRNE